MAEEEIKEPVKFEASWDGASDAERGFPPTDKVEGRVVKGGQLRTALKKGLSISVLQRKCVFDRSSDNFPFKKS